MADKKHHVFSARTTPEGLDILNGIRAGRKIGWDELVIAAVNAHYGVEVPMPARAESKPKAEKLSKIERPKAKAEKPKAKTERPKAKAKGEAKILWPAFGRQPTRRGKAGTRGG